ncbi:putative type II secretion system protein [Selenomonas ruminantium subsp. lactilytica TAM6421]|uniref:Putative type II secretion system protein n=1 Tax=Selenomonas ruminantium subsp. lactilytica (strain NBRC 103574 / TAM6421) TaxID=927704 RepID=I0GS35_SELRL|nr:type II secretion system F family protein [Selenomonas ruminantium]BAL83572.1 putative type II secretion system protein [Selenomonas ruminantium subsp. lactilytica TAM6421]
MKLALSLAVTLLTFGLLMMLIRIRMRQHTDLVNRMEYFSGAAMRLRQQELRGERAKAVAKDRFRNFVQRAGAWVRKIQHSGNSMDFKMQQADWPLLGSEFEVILGLLGGLCAAITMAATLEPLWSLAAFAGGVILGLMFLSIHIKRRQKAFTNQLGDMLTMVANALRAGFSFMQAFEHIAREMDAPIGREVQKVVNEVNIGVDLETALDNMQKRVNSPDFELVVTAVLIQRQVGGNLAQIMDTISDTINERIRMRREIMALTAQGRASGIVLTALPIALGFVLSIINPTYLQPLFTEPIGRMFMVAAIVMEIVGYLVIQKIVNIKF